MPRKQLLSDIKTIVVKVGTSVITENGDISSRKILHLVQDIVALIEKGYEVVLVSSGAIGSGAGLLGKDVSSLSIPEKQACAAMGQVALINEYNRHFKTFGYNVGQILLTEDDVSNRRRFLNARNTFLQLLKQGVIPIVNENDSVVVKEIKFGDNDTLSAHITSLINADLLILLSDVDGFYDNLDDPMPVDEIFEITDDIKSKSGGEGSVYGTGGMYTKILAAEKIIYFGEKMIIASGEEEHVLKRIISGEKIGTIFVGQNKTLSSRKKWVSLLKSNGSIVIDQGAEKAVMMDKKSLLAIGIVSFSGEFDMGDAVDIVNKNGKILGKGIINYKFNELSGIIGKKNLEIKDILGSRFFDEVVNRDDMIVF